jgi:DivIVA domain-containing protein
MGLTPDDVENKQFVRVMRGYDPTEVATFLRVVAAHMRQQQSTIDTVGDPAQPFGDEVVSLLRAAYEAAQTRGRPRRPASGRKASANRTAKTAPKSPVKKAPAKASAKRTVAAPAQKRPLRVAGR